MRRMSAAIQFAAAEPGKTPVDDDEVAVSHNEPWLVLQRRREAFHKVEKTVAAWCNVRACAGCSQATRTGRRRRSRAG